MALVQDQGLSFIWRLGVPQWVSFSTRSWWVFWNGRKTGCRQFCSVCATFNPNFWQRVRKTAALNFLGGRARQHYSSNEGAQGRIGWKQSCVKTNTNHLICQYLSYPQESIEFIFQFNIWPQIYLGPIKMWLFTTLHGNRGKWKHSNPMRRDGCGRQMSQKQQQRECNIGIGENIVETFLMPT